jgi:hypothetical protein
MQLTVKKVAATRYDVTLTKDDGKVVKCEIEIPESVSDKGLARRARKWAATQGVTPGTCIPVNKVVSV